MKILRIALVAVLVAVAASCGGDDDDAATTSSTSSTSAAPRLEADVDWRDRTVTMRGETRFDVAFCEGEAPMLCVSDDGGTLGIVERATFPAPVADLDAWARAHYATLAQDRIAGCDPDYGLDGDDAVHVELEPIAGIRYGFTGTIDGRVVERVIGYAVSSDAGLDLLVANALADDGCLARESELPVEAMDDLAPVLDALAHGSRLGDASESWFIGDGLHEARLAGVTASTLTVDPAALLNGEEAVVTARIDGELPPDGELPNDFYIVDHEDDVVELAVGEALVVELIDCSEGCERRPVDAAEFLAGEATPFGGAEAFVELEVVDGAAVAVREIYLP